MRILQAAVVGVAAVSAVMAALPAAATAEHPGEITSCSDFGGTGRGAGNTSYCEGSRPSTFYAYVICSFEGDHYEIDGKTRYAGSGSSSTVRCDDNAYLVDSGHRTHG